MNREHYAGTLIGVAVGDTLGMAVEGWKAEQITKHLGRIREPMDPVIVYDASGNEVCEDEFGKLKYWTRNLKKGQMTDDLVLTLAVGEAIVRARGLNLSFVSENHLQVMAGEEKRYGGTMRAYGRTTMDAMARLADGVPPEKSGVIGGPGNAPPMKMSPVGIYMAASGKYDEGLTFAEHVGMMTHLDPRSVAAGVIQAHAIYSLLRGGMTRADFVRSLEAVGREWEKPLTAEYTFFRAGTLLSRLQWIRANADSSVEDAYRVLGASSSVYQSYPFALFMFQKYWDSPLEGLLETVNYGGDCDTTGSMYGALAGAKNGMIFPSAWVNLLETKERVSSLAEQLGALR